MRSRKIRFLLTGISALFLIELASMTIRAGQPDGKAGKEVYTKRCSGCHALDSDRTGPRLRGVFNRTAGAVPGFLYSDALRKSGVSWDDRSLNEWLENPDAVVKDNDMEASVANADERRLIIDYLKSIAK